MFAIFFPVAWPTSSGVIADPSARTCIVSLVNQHGRSCRLRLKAGEEKYAVSRDESDGPCFGGGYDVSIWTEDGTHCYPLSFELDAEAERDAGLQSLPFVYNQALLSGVDDGKVERSPFSLAELECYMLDA